MLDAIDDPTAAFPPPAEPPEAANPLDLPRVAALAGGARVRVTRADAQDVVFDRLGPAPAPPPDEEAPAPAPAAAEIVLDAACAVPGGEFADFAAVIAHLDNPPPIVLAVPLGIRNAQLRQQLAAMGLLDQVEAAVSAAGGAAKIRWEFEAGVLRRDALVGAIAAVLALDEGQIDDIFRAAAQIP